MNVAVARPTMNQTQVGTPGVAGLNDLPGGATSATRGTQNAELKGPQFQELLNSKIATLDPQKAAATSKLKFSNHAIERMQSRGIRFTGEDMKKLDSAVEKAAQKGSKDTLVLINDAALIVNIKNRTVVTAMDKSLMKENVFTNIDSTVVI